MAYFYVGAARLVVPALFGWLLVQACAATAPDGVATGGAGAGGSTSSGGTRVVAPGAAGAAGAAGAGGAGELNPLCGVQPDGCVPDDKASCANFGPPQQALLSLAGGSGGDGGASGAGGAGGGGGEAGTAGGGGGGGGEAGSAGGGALGTGGVVQPPDKGDAGAGGSAPPQYACRVSRESDGPHSACGATGGGNLDAPCFTGSDCGEGLGCAMLGSVARCRPYCCAGDSSCVAGTYCAERPLSDDSLSSRAAKTLIPVCIPADNCDLAEIAPCTPGQNCQCPAETACTVVRPDGTTACVTEGSGQLGEPCPCRAGFVCSRASEAGTCVQLCATEGSSDEALTCASGRCQASAELPRGFGVCVGVGSEKP